MKNKTILIIAYLTIFGYTADVFSEINMGIFPRRTISTTVKIYKPLAKKLAEELGEPVNIKVSKNFKKFWSELVSGKYDIVHLNQYQYLLAKKQSGYRVFAVNEEFGSSQISGAISVRADSGIKTVDDLKGKKIIFGGGKKAMGSYIAPSYMLKKAGLVEGVDYKISFAKNPISAVTSTFKGLSDASGSGDVILNINSVKKRINTAEMKIILRSDPFIHLPWAVNKNMSDEKMLKIQNIMTSLKNDNEAILKSAKVTNFVKASDADFGAVRKIVEFITGEKL